MFVPVRIGGQEIDPSHSGVLLDVVADYGLTDPDAMYGAGRKTANLSSARIDAWRRLDAMGVRRSHIARMFGVNKASITIGIQRAEAKDIGLCPCCGRPLGDRRFT